MSHFVVYVFSKKAAGTDLEELLAPYDENIVYDPYIKYTREQAIAKVRDDIEDYKNGTYAEFIADPEGYKEKWYCNDGHIKYLEEEFPKKLNWTDDECYQYMCEWYDDEDIDEEGNIYSTYNPKSKWDWYEVGGRWDGVLMDKSGNGLNKGYINQINWEKTDVPFAFITPDGDWYERGKMGWWCAISNEKDQDDWNKEFINIIKELDDDVYVTAVDCHI